MKHRAFYPSAFEHIRLWWHCLTHLHRRAIRKDNGVITFIGCWDCAGKPEFDSDWFQEV